MFVNEKISVDRGEFSNVKNYLECDKVDPSCYSDLAMHTAAENGYVDIVELLLADPRVDPSNDQNFAIRIASKNSHSEIVRLLLNDPRVLNGNQEALAHSKIQEILEENRATKTAILWNCGVIRGAWRDLGSMIAEKVSI